MKSLDFLVSCFLGVFFVLFFKFTVQSHQPPSRPQQTAVFSEHAACYLSSTKQPKHTVTHMHLLETKTELSVFNFNYINQIHKKLFGDESATLFLQLLADKLAITKVYKYNISMLCSQLVALFPNGEEFCNIMYNIAL